MKFKIYFICFRDERARVDDERQSKRERERERARELASKK